jgi:DDE superfamily endonuclease
MNIPACIMPLLMVFRPAFSTPTDHRVLVLVPAAVLTTGRRPVTNLLRTVRFRAQGHVSSYHRVFSQRRWSTWALARAWITCLLDHVVPSGPVLLAGDETVTEHPGPHVFGKGRHRDGVRSTHSSIAYRWGHTWVVVSMLVQLPCATRPWALPLLVALVPSPRGGWGAGHAASDAGAHGPAAAGAPDPLVSRSPRHRRRRQRLRSQRDGAVVPEAPPAPHVSEPV